MTFRLSLCYASYHPHSALFAQDVGALMEGLAVSTHTYTHVRIACIENNMEYRSERDLRQGIDRIRKCVKHHAMGAMSVALKSMIIDDYSYREEHPIHDIKILLAGR